MTLSTLVLATKNPGKIAEIEWVLRDLPLKLVPQDHFSNIPTCDETGLTFIENAILKARHAAAYCNLPVLADDSGLVVLSLHGEPGIYSARFAGKDATDQRNWKRLLDKLKAHAHTEREAYFYCCLVLMRYATDPTPLVAEGWWYGMIAFEPKGNQGFGYDPLFYLPDLQCTAAELTLEEKNRISHRAMALRSLKKALLQELGHQD